MELLGITASLCFVGGTLFQAVKCYKDGHAKGVSHGIIWTLLLGFILMGIHIMTKFGWDLALMGSLIGQIICFMVIARYKYWERVKDYSDLKDVIDKHLQKK